MRAARSRLALICAAQLKRFAFGQYGSQKIASHFAFPDVLEMAEFMDNGPPVPARTPAIRAAVAPASPALVALAPPALPAAGTGSGGVGAGEGGEADIAAAAAMCDAEDAPMEAAVAAEAVVCATAASVERAVDLAGSAHASHVYLLHSVLVHSGSTYGGHYVAYVRPGLRGLTSAPLLAGAVSSEDGVPAPVLSASAAERASVSDQAATGTAMTVSSRVAAKRSLPVASSDDASGGAPAAAAAAAAVRKRARVAPRPAAVKGCSDGGGRGGGGNDSDDSAENCSVRNTQRRPGDSETKGVTESEDEAESFDGVCAASDDAGLPSEQDVFIRAPRAAFDGSPPVCSRPCWLKFNDAAVTACDEYTAIAANFGGHSCAYMLVYVARDSLGELMFDGPSPAPAGVPCVACAADRVVDVTDAVNQVETPPGLCRVLEVQEAANAEAARVREYEASLVTFRVFTNADMDSMRTITSTGGLFGALFHYHAPGVRVRVSACAMAHELRAKAAVAVGMSPENARLWILDRYGGACVGVVNQTQRSSATAMELAVSGGYRASLATWVGEDDLVEDMINVMNKECVLVWVEDVSAGLHCLDMLGTAVDTQSAVGLRLDSPVPSIRVILKLYSHDARASLLPPVFPIARMSVPVLLPIAAFVSEARRLASLTVPGLAPDVELIAVTQRGHRCLGHVAVTATACGAGNLPLLCDGSVVLLVPKPVAACVKWLLSELCLTVRIVAHFLDRSAYGARAARDGLGAASPVLHAAGKDTAVAEVKDVLAGGDATWLGHVIELHVLSKTPWASIARAVAEQARVPSVLAENVVVGKLAPTKFEWHAPEHIIDWYQTDVEVHWEVCGEKYEVAAKWASKKFHVQGIERLYNGVSTESAVMAADVCASGAELRIARFPDLTAAHVVIAWVAKLAGGHVAAAVAAGGRKSMLIRAVANGHVSVWQGDDAVPFNSAVNDRTYFQLRVLRDESPVFPAGTNEEGRQFEWVYVVNVLTSTSARCTFSLVGALVAISRDTRLDSFLACAAGVLGLGGVAGKAADVLDSFDVYCRDDKGGLLGERKSVVGAAAARLEMSEGVLHAPLLSLDRVFVPLLAVQSPASAGRDPCGAHSAVDGGAVPADDFVMRQQRTAGLGVIVARPDVHGIDIPYEGRRVPVPVIGISRRQSVLASDVDRRADAPLNISKVRQ